MAVVISLGQCGMDHGSLSRLLRTHFHVNLMGVDTPAEARERLTSHPGALLLVNRVLDRSGESGLDVIRALKNDPATRDVRVMLVSNYREAQEQAIALGAIPGFGKDALGRSETLALLRAALSSPAEGDVTRA